MAYRCLSCSHKGARFPAGACPGCGSFNIRKVADKKPEPVARKPYRLVLALVLWLYLVVEIYRQLST
jgi:predicted ATP-dependent serine protease